MASESTSLALARDTGAMAFDGGDAYSYDCCGIHLTLSLAGESRDRQRH